MIEKVKELMKIKEELYEEYSVLSVSKTFRHSRTISVHVHGIDKFLEITKDLVVTDEQTSMEDSLIKVSVEDGDIEYFALLDEEEYQEYKNSRSPQATKEKNCMK